MNAEGKNTAIAQIEEQDILAVMVPKGVGPTEEPVSLAKRRFDTLIGEQLSAFTAEGNAMLAVAHGYTIRSPEDYVLAGERLKQTKTLWNKMEDGRKIFTVPLNAILNHINSTVKGVQDVVSQAERIWKGLVVEWDSEQDRIRREAQRKADEEARREQERLRTLAEQRAQRAEAKGDTERAEQIRESVPQVVLPTVIMPESPKVKGISIREEWDFEITDANTLLTACAAGEVPRNAMMVNEQYVRKAVKTLGSAFNWPGIRTFKRSVVASGRA